MAKKYVSRIVKGKDTLYIKDSEARDNMPTLATESAVRSIVTEYGNNQ